jgi:multicomponent Na+:H+ antiporter subunit D
MIDSIPPALVLIAGALCVPVVRGRAKPFFMLLVPAAAFYAILQLPEGKSCVLPFLDYDLILARTDRLSLIFGYIFTLITFVGALFAFRVKDDVQHMAALFYAGGALGVTFAGDFFSLYIFWEVMAVASTFLILARRTTASRQAAFRYIMVHIVGGLVLLAGIIMAVSETGTIEFSYIGLEGVSAWLIFLGIAVNAAIPPVHPWLKDAYPEATVTGAVFMSALTTKSAVYVMARTFPGADPLIWIGAFMTAYPIFYAILENDIRRVLSYSLINQVGYMMVGIGIGTELSINGTVSHAFCHILYKALLFMSVGAVLYRTGKSKCTELGGLYKTMPLTCLFCLIGAASISAFPLFSGFVSKSMIISASAHEKLVVVWLILQFASAGVLDHAGIKVPFFTFFGHDSGIRTKEAPLPMLLAMGIAAFFCVFLAVCPGFLYGMLPYPVDYEPYTAGHVVGSLQLLLFGALAFVLLLFAGFYPSEIRAQNLDSDLFYRKGGRAFAWVCDKVLNGLNRGAARLFMGVLPAALGRFTRDGPAWIALLLLEPFWVLAWLSEKERGVRRKLLFEKMRAGALPIGLIALSVIVCLGILCFFTAWL